jgi:hypothetical protein
MSIFSKVFDRVLALARAVTGSGKPSVIDIAAGVIGVLEEGLLTWNAYRGADARERIEEVWSEFDVRTGLEGADIFRNLPQEAEEELFDGVKAIGRVLTLWSAGCYGARPELSEIKSFKLNLVNAVIANVEKVPVAPNNSQAGAAPAVIAAPPGVVVPSLYLFADGAVDRLRGGQGMLTAARIANVEGVLINLLLELRAAAAPDTGANTRESLDGAGK